MSTTMYLEAVKITIGILGIIFVAVCVFNGLKKLLRD